jgi:acetyl-CoA acetyltransferase
MANRLNRVAIVGVGYSQVGRRVPLTDDELVLQAVTAAMDDAGLSRSDVDAITTMGGDAMSLGWTLGFSPLSYYLTAPVMLGGPAFAGPAINAIAAVASGLCHTCVAIRLIRRDETRGGGLPDGPPSSEPVRVSGEMQFTAPFGSGAAASFAGLMMQAHMSRYGSTEEQFAINAVTQRHYASLNDDALLRERITVEDYLESRYVCKPVRLFDCDYPVDAASAVIFTEMERARDCRKKPVNVEAYALAALRNHDHYLIEDHAAHNAPQLCADRLWSRTDLRPRDVDVAELYDGFSIITFEWLEALGFCGEGEAGSFIGEGHTRLDGSLPLNTDGGACNVGRRHGANFCIEAVQQLRGECGERQVPNASVAVWSNAPASYGGAVLLTA